MYGSSTGEEGQDPSQGFRPPVYRCEDTRAHTHTHTHSYETKLFHNKILNLKQNFREFQENKTILKSSKDIKQTHIKKT